MKVGDAIKLTGPQWEHHTGYNLKAGMTVIIKEIDQNGYYHFIGHGGRWSLHNNVGHAFEVVTEPEPEPMIEKYAAQLSPLDIGRGRKIVWLKKYRYAKEDREKLIEIYEPISLGYNQSVWYGNEAQVLVVGYPVRYHGRYDHQQFEFPVGTKLLVGPM